MSKIPEFTAYDVNTLASKARRSDYYKACHEFVKQIMGSKENGLTEKQIKRAWGIRLDLDNS